MTAAIFVGEDKHHPIPGVDLTVPERIVVLNWPAFGRLGLPKGTHPSVSVKAQVRQGRWMVLCPWCPSAQNASQDDHRFFCTDCSNGPADGQWVTVEWPPERDEIEAALGRRPHPLNRNWLPLERPAGLWTENADEGVV